MRIKNMALDPFSVRSTPWSSNSGEVKSSQDGAAPLECAGKEKENISGLKANQQDKENVKKLQIHLTDICQIKSNL